MVIATEFEEHMLKTSAQVLFPYRYPICISLELMNKLSMHFIHSFWKKKTLLITLHFNFVHNYVLVAFDDCF